MAYLLLQKLRYTISVLDTMRVNSYDYGLASNMTMRNKGMTWNQRMRWDSHNRLAEMSGAGVSEGYVYDEGGQRLRPAEPETRRSLAVV